jgi:hypothetical protein
VRAASIPRCSASKTAVWFGLGLGDGAAGTIYYPLEFSNTGRRACTLYGYPGVSGYGASAQQIVSAARRLAGVPARTVTLQPGGSAHSLLGIVDWGALCPVPVTASGLTVYPPGERAAQQVPFQFQGCPQAGVLIVGPVRAGVGIPGYTTG